MDRNEYEEKQERKRQRYLDRADKAEAESAERGKRVRQISDMIPLGQPILVGHHSEKRHRADLKRIDSNTRKSMEASDKAAHYKQKAESVGKGGISSDDPEAIQKLKGKLANLEFDQERMRLTNKAHKAYLKNPASLDTWNGPESAKELIRNYRPGYSWEPHPYAPYRLTNNNGNIRRIKQRIADLEKLSDLETTTKKIGEIEIIQNVEENRTQAFFPGKPSAEIRTKLKQNGFRWSRYNGCWQRHLSRYANDVAEQIAKEV